MKTTTRHRFHLTTIAALAFAINACSKYAFECDGAACEHASAEDLEQCIGHLCRIDNIELRCDDNLKCEYRELPSAESESRETKPRPSCKGSIDSCYGRSTRSGSCSRNPNCEIDYGDWSDPYDDECEENGDLYICGDLYDQHDCQDAGCNWE